MWHVAAVTTLSLLYIAQSHSHCKKSFFTEQTSWLLWC